MSQIIQEYEELISSPIRKLFKHSKDVIFLFRVENENQFIYSYANPVYLNIVNKKEEEVIGKRVVDILGLEIGKMVHSQFQAVLSSKKQKQFELTVPEGNSFKTYDRTLSPILNEDNVVTHILGIGHDISEQKQFESWINEFNNPQSNTERNTLLYHFLKCEWFEKPVPCCRI